MYIIFVAISILVSSIFRPKIAYYYLYAFFVSLIFSVVKVRQYEDDFYGYYSHYIEYVNNGIVPFYSEGKEFVLTSIFVTFGLTGIDSVVFFSFFNKLLLYLLLLKFYKNYNGCAQWKTVGCFILLLAFPNFIIYTDSFIRQTLSLAILLLGLTYGAGYRIIFFLIACFTHSASILFFPIYFFQFNTVLLYGLVILSYLIPGIDYSVFKELAAYLGMSDKAVFIDKMYEFDNVNTKPAITTFLMPLFLIAVACFDKIKSLQRYQLCNLFLYAIFISNIASDIPFAANRIGMLAIAFAPILFVLFQQRLRLLLALPFILITWARFVVVDDATLEVNYKYLTWPFFVHN